MEQQANDNQHHMIIESDDQLYYGEGPDNEDLLIQQQQMFEHEVPPQQERYQQHQQQQQPQQQQHQHHQLVNIPAETASLESLREQIGMTYLDYLHAKGNNPQDAFIASGIHDLDVVLRNGLRTGIVTEIYGPDQSCKTSLALQFALNAIVNEKSDKKVYCIYLSTIKRPHQQRINQILEGIRSRNAEQLRDRSLESVMEQFLEVSAPSVKAFEHFIAEELPNYQSRLGVIRLLVVDNIYDLASQVDDFRERQVFLFTLVNLLKRFAQKSSAAVLILNNVVANITDNNNSNAVGILTNTSATLPALGNYWAHLINERYALSILSEVRGSMMAPLKVRSLAIKFSPRLPYDTFRFIPDNFGISPISN